MYTIKHTIKGIDGPDSYGNYSGAREEQLGTNAYCDSSLMSDGNHFKSAPDGYCYVSGTFAGSQDANCTNCPPTPPSDGGTCKIDTSGTYSNCQLGCLVGGSSYEVARNMPSQNCGNSGDSVFQCLTARPDTCVYKSGSTPNDISNLTTDQLMNFTGVDVDGSTQKTYQNVPEDYYNICGGGQKTWWVKPYGSEPGTQATFVQQTCLFDSRNFVNTNQIEAYVNQTDFVENSDEHQKNSDQLVIGYCSKQIQNNEDGVGEVCRNGRDTCSRYMADPENGGAQFCQNYLENARNSVSDPTRFWRMYNTIAQNYCLRYPSDPDCSCMMRNSYNGKVYQTLKNGAPYNDGCWYSDCNTTSYKDKFITNEVNIIKTPFNYDKAAQNANCPACACSDSLIFYDDNSVNVTDNQTQINCQEDQYCNTPSSS